MNIKKISMGLLFLLLALVIVPGSVAYPERHPPASSEVIKSCDPGCHGVPAATFCITCHTGYPTFVLNISSSPTSVTAGIATPVTFTVRNGGSDGPLVNGALVSLSGAGVPSGTNGSTDSTGTVTISVNAATSGAILATATKTTSYTNGTTTVTANAAPDNSPPVITMLGSTPIDIVVGSVYTDAGATATDNVDGDLTSAIVTVNSVNTSIIGNYTVTYNVADAAGNKAVEAVRTVNVIGADPDITPPVITMLGSTPIDIVVGSVYTDAGATATDNVDGDLTSAIVTVNSVNTSIIGNYTVTYNIADAAGNKAVEAVRTVNVVAAPLPGENGTIKFIVTDDKTGKPIHGAKVNLGGKTIRTGNNGIAIFANMVPGDYKYKVSKDDYLKVKGTIAIVAGDQTVNVKLVNEEAEEEDDHEDHNKYIEKESKIEHPNKK